MTLAFQRLFFAVGEIVSSQRCRTLEMLKLTDRKELYQHMMTDDFTLFKLFPTTKCRYQ